MLDGAVLCCSSNRSHLKPPAAVLKRPLHLRFRAARVYQTSQPVHVTAVYYLLFVPPGHSQKTTAPWWPQPTPASAPPRESWSTARQPNSAWRRYQVLRVNTYAERPSRVISLCVGVLHEDVPVCINISHLYYLRLELNLPHLSICIHTMT